MIDSVINILSLTGLIGGFAIKTEGRNFLIYTLVFLLIPLAASVKGFTLYEIAFIFIFLFIIIESLGIYSVATVRFYDSSRILIYYLLFVLSLIISISFSLYVSSISLLSCLKASFPFLLLTLLLRFKFNFGTKQKKYLLWALVLAGFAISVKCILLVIGSGYLFINPMVGKSGTPFNSALYLFIIPFFLVLFFYEKKKSLKLILGILFFLFTWRFLIDFRRHALFIYLFSIILVIYFSKFQYDYWKVLQSKLKVVLPFGIIFILLIVGWEGAKLIKELNMQSLVHRLSFQSILLGLKTRFALDFKAWDYFWNNPFFGVGIGKNPKLYGVVNQAFLTGASKLHRSYSVSKVHNLYLFILMNGGLVLFIPFGLFIANLFKKLKFLIKKVALEPVDFYWCIGSIIFLINYLILGIFSVKTISLEAWLVLGIVSGITMSIYAKYKLRYK